MKMCLPPAQHDQSGARHVYHCTPCYPDDIPELCPEYREAILEKVKVFSGRFWFKYGEYVLENGGKVLVHRAVLVSETPGDFSPVYKWKITIY
jgi:hypothetical protein